MAVVVLSVLAPFIGALAAALTPMWAWNVENIRVRDGHISYRAAQLPATRHGWAAWLIATEVFAAVATLVMKGGGVVARVKRNPFR